MNNEKANVHGSFTKCKSKISFLKIHDKTDFLGYKLLPQKRPQNPFKNDYMQTAPSKKTSLLKLVIFNTSYHNHQKKFLGHQPYT